MNIIIYIYSIFIFTKKMSIKITIQDNEWKNLGHFVAEDNKSFANMAKENNVEIVTSCGVWACGICKCKIIEWYDFIQVDKISKPLSDLPTDAEWKINTIFTCIAGVKSEYIDDGNDYDIVLQRNI